MLVVGIDSVIHTFIEIHSHLKVFVVI